MPKDKITRISLWSGPRNISTALMYSFAQRKDTKVFDEPLYAYYLKNSSAISYHPGANEILRTMENDGEEVVKMMLEIKERSVLFFKNMTHHILDLDKSFMKKMVNVILTRAPEEMLPSFARVIENPTMKDVGYFDHIELIDFFRSQEIPYVVLDAKKTLLNPEGVLKQLCQFAEISFDPKMLTWEPQKRPEDGLWAEYWYDSVHQSSGFSEYRPKQQKFPEHLIPLLKESQPFYDQLAVKALS